MFVENCISSGPTPRQKCGYWVALFQDHSLNALPPCFTTLNLWLHFLLCFDSFNNKMYLVLMLFISVTSTNVVE